jgi:thioredoxin-related protein
MKYLAVLLFCISSFAAHATEPSAIKWHKFNDVEELQKTSSKKVFIDVFTDWCGWCKKMDATTFSHPVIVKLMNQYFYAVKLDAENAEIINYKGKQYTKPNDRKQTPNDFAAMILNGKMSYPTTVYLDETLTSFGPVPGYLEPKTLEKILHYYGENHFKTISWPDFEKNFVSEIK